MKKAFDDYERIAKGMFGMSSIWLGEDHLLYISGRGFLLPFREEYKRYRYQDIQAVSIVKTAGMWGFGALLLLSLVIWTLILVSSVKDTDMSSVSDVVFSLGFPALFSLVSLILLIRNFMLGSRCKCELETGLKHERLIPLSRFPQAKEATALLEERVLKAQSND